MTAECTLQAYDGTELYAKSDCVADPRAAIVIVHGLCEHLGRYDYLTARLNARGYSVYRFDHRGHGKSAGQKVFYKDRTEIVKDIDTAVEWALYENPGVPVYMIGHSMGGYGATSYATAHPGKCDGYILSGAWTRDYAGLAADAVNAEGDDLTYFSNSLAGGVCSDPTVGERYMKDPLVVKEISLGLMRTVADGHAWLKENAANFSDPVIILHGAEDGLVSPKDSLELFEQISSTDKSLHIFAGLMHEIFNEYDKDTVIDMVLAWLNERADIVYDIWEEEEEEIDE